MISVKDALKVVLDNIRILSSEKVKTLSSLNRVLAEDIYAKSNVPPFNNSAMDGYALLASDTRKVSSAHSTRLKAIEDIPAGYVAKKRVVKGQAIRIMTGAPTPKGADAVIMVEDTRIKDDEVEVLKKIKKGVNIRKVGEDIKKGNLVVNNGIVIGPAEMGLFASLGINSVKVIKKPKIAILVTGDELVKPEQNLVPGKIRSSNNYTLYAQTLKCGGIPINLGIVRDKANDIKNKLKSGLTADMVLVSGGISVGNYDFVKDVLADLGTQMKFWKVAMKPGKPLAFGLIKGKPIFGLPGNPVSSMVSFEQFVRPAIFKMSGRKRFKKPEINTILQEDIRKNPGKVHFVRAWTVVKDGVYHSTVTGPQGSGILRSMSLANSLIIVPKEVNLLKKGAIVKAQILD